MKLNKDYDAASKILNDNWNIPTKAQIRELMEYTLHEYVENYKNYGVPGVLFISKDSSNDAEMFVPFSGYKLDNSISHNGEIAFLMSRNVATFLDGKTKCYNVLRIRSPHSARVDQLLMCYASPIHPVTKKEKQ